MVSNDLTKRILELETQINRLAIERQNFFNIEAQLKNEILEKEDLLQEKEEAVKMTKAQLIILLEEIDNLKRNNKMLTANSTLIPSNVIKKIRGGNHNEKVSNTYLNTDFNDTSILTGNEMMTARGGQKGKLGQVSIGKNSSSLANSFAQSRLLMTARQLPEHEPFVVSGREEGDRDRGEGQRQARLVDVVVEDAGTGPEYRAEHGGVQEATYGQGEDGRGQGGRRAGAEERVHGRGGEGGSRQREP